MKINIAVSTFNTAFLTSHRAAFHVRLSKGKSCARSASLLGRGSATIYGCRKKLEPREARMLIFRSDDLAGAN